MSKRSTGCQGWYGAVGKSTSRLTFEIPHSLTVSRATSRHVGLNAPLEPLQTRRRLGDFVPVLCKGIGRFRRRTFSILRAALALACRVRGTSSASFKVAMDGEVAVQPTMRRAPFLCSHSNLSLLDLLVMVNQLSAQYKAKDLQYAM